MDWDDKIKDQEILMQWYELINDLERFSQIKIPRCISLSVDPTSVEYNLLCFCDVSSRAYATAIYLQQTSKDATDMNLVFSKSRLAQVKGLTIPRLELMAVLIGVRCLQFVNEQLKLKINKKLLWTDSQCVIGWLNSVKKLDAFVQNRVSEIKGHKEITVQYIKSCENPADVAIRGTNVEDLITNKTWWHGPNLCFSITSPNEIYIGKEKVTETNEVEEFENSAIVVVGEKVRGKELHIKAPFGINRSKFSSLTNLFRVTAYVNRFIRRILKQPFKRGFIHASEIKDAEQMWLKYVQQVAFPDEIEGILMGKPTNLQRELGLSSSTGRRPASLCHGPLSVVRPAVHPSVC